MPNPAKDVAARSMANRAKKEAKLADADVTEINRKINEITSAVTGLTGRIAALEGIVNSSTMGNAALNTRLTALEKK